MAKQPKMGSRAWDQQLYQSPNYAKNTILDLAKRASGGDKQAVDSLHGWLSRHPSMRSLIRELDDLAIQVERVWVEKVSGNNQLRKKSVEAGVTAMRAELLGASPSVTDRIMASAVLTSNLAFQNAALLAAQDTGKPEVQEARERLMTIALKRLVAATKNWKQIAAKKAGGMRSPLKVFAPTPPAV